METGYYWKNCIKFSVLGLTGLPVFERQMWVCIPGQEEPQADQLDCAVQTQAQEGPVCKSLMLDAWVLQSLTGDFYFYEWQAWSPLSDVVWLRVDGVHGVDLCYVVLLVCVLQS